MHIKLGISGTYWDRSPRYRVLYNNVVQCDSSIGVATGDVEYIEFDVNQCSDTGNIAVELLDKNDNDTVQNSEKTSIIKDLLLNIVSLEVDGDSLDHLIYNKSEYRPDYPDGFQGDRIQVISGVNTLGWNGVWNVSWVNHNVHNKMIGQETDPGSMPESLKIKLGILGNFWDRRPEYRISFNEKIVAQEEFSSESGKIQYIEFPVEYGTSTGTIYVELLNKRGSDTVQNDDKTQIVNDMTLEIVDLEIDQISVKTLLHGYSKFYPRYSVGYDGDPVFEVSDCVTLGRNGIWAFSWTNPFYIWLLESL